MSGPAGITIRSGRPDELSALATVAADAALTRPKTDFCDREGCIPLARLAASHAEGLLWTAVDGANRPVGVLAATIADDALHVVMLAAARAHQRRGVGRSLMEQAISHGRWAFFSAVTLMADPEAPSGAPFYRRLGFVALRPEGLGPDLAAFLRADRIAVGSPTERIAMAKVL